MKPMPGALVVAGPSGVGKSTLINHALAELDGWRFSVSATTRPQREGEEDGREYHFVDRQRFMRMVAAGELLEYAEVYGNFYGTPRDELRRAAMDGKSLLIEVDTVGCLSIRALLPEIPLVGVLPPSLPALRERLAGRGTESEETVNTRFANAVSELQRIRGFDYVITNDDLAKATMDLLTLMQVVQAGLHLAQDRVDVLLTSTGGTK